MPLQTLPTTEEIRNRIITDIESKINQSTPSFFKSFNRVLAAALAFVFTLLYKYGQWTYKQIFTITQSDESLELKGEQYDIPRKDSVATQITADATGTIGTTIEAGKIFRASKNGLNYSVVTTVQNLSGTVELTLNCLTAGIAGNLLVSDSLTVQQPQAGLDNIITVTATVIEGEDREPIEEFRARIQEIEKRPPQGGALVDYIIWAKEVAGVTRAFAFGKREESSITAGVVEVYPLTDDDVAGRIPSSEKLTEIENYIDSPTRAPTQAVAINVIAFTERTFDIDITALDPDNATIRNSISENIPAFLLSREPQQFTDQIDIKNVISRSYLESICIQSGATSVTLTSTIDGGGVEESYELDYDEISALDGSIAFP
jgi:uncharacterized phage protein gp47/JayE